MYCWSGGECEKVVSLGTMSKIVPRRTSKIRLGTILSAVMENLTPEQRSQLEISQFKDFLTTYNHVTENCFVDCVHDFTSRRVTKQEVDCCTNCVDKYVKMTQRVSLRLQEHYQMQQSGNPQGLDR